MRDIDKTREQLMDELLEMRQRVVDLEASEDGCKQAEETTKAERAKLQTLVDGLASTQIGIDIIGLDYKVQFQNQVLIERFGDLTGRLCYEEYMGLKRPCDFCPMIKAIKSNKVQGVELTAADGRDYQLLSAPFPNPDGTVDKVIEVVLDITERKQAEEKLKASEQEKASISRSISELVVHQDNEMRILWANKVALESVDLLPEEIIGRRCYEVWPQRSEPCIDCPVVKSRETGQPQEAEITTPDGKVWLIRGDPIRDANGDITGAIESTLDITERKQIEKTLQFERDKLTSILDSMEDGVYIANSQYEVEYVNPVIETQFGPVKGRKCYKYLHDRKEVCPWCPNQAVFAGETVRWEWYSFKNQRTYDLIDTPLRNADGSISKLEIFRDITERKQVEEKLRESEEKYRGLIEGLSENLYRMSLPDGTYEYLSSTTKDIFGYSAEEFLDKPLLIREIIHPEFADYFKEQWANLIEGKVSPTYEYKIIDPVGKERWIVQSNKGIFDSKGNVIAIEGICRDITERKQAEESLRESEEKFRTLFEESRDALFINAQDGRLIDVNQAFLDLFSLTREEAIGMNVWETYANPDDRLMFQREMEQKGAVRDFELKLRKKDGREIDCLLTTTLRKTKDGDILGYQGFIRNITERKRMEDELQIAEQNFRNSMDNSPLGIRVVTIEGELLYANQAVLDIYGYSSIEELKAVPTKKRYTPQSYAEHQERIQRRNLGKPIPPNYEISIVRKDGEIRHLTVSRKAVVWGGEVQYQVIYQDVTERRRSEEQTKQLREYLQLQVERMPIGLIVWDTEFRVQTWNPAAEEIFGFTVEEAMGKHPYEIIVPREVQPQVDDIWRRLLEGDKTAHSVNENITKDGRTIICDWSNTPLKEADGTVKGILSMVQDITERRRAEGAMRESEEKFRTLFEESRDALFITTQDGRLVDANQAYLDLFGLTREEAIGMDIREAYANPDDRLMFQREMEQKGAVRDFELELRKSDGREMDCLLTTTLRKTKDGDILGYQGFIRDITERKQAEEKLRESEEFSLSLLSNSPIPVIVINPDTSIRYVNPALEGLTGFTSAELTSSEAPYPWWTEETLRRIGKDFREALYKGVERVEELFQRKNGERFWVEITSIPVVNNGEPKYYLASWVDVTERKRAEEKIKQAAEEWRTTFDSINDFIFICDEDFRLARVNKAFADAFNMKPEELIGKHCYEMVHGTNEPVFNCPHKQTMKTKKPATVDFFEPHLGIHLELAASPIFNEEGEVVACVRVARDITERKKMEERLIVTDRLASIGELSSGIAHELNNPLTGVIGFSDLLLDKKGLPDDIRGDLEVINREAQRTARVVRNLLTFARKHPQEKKPVDINSIIEKVLELRAYEQKVNNIEVVTRFAPDLPEITANDFDLQQVFLNIVINAEHFMIEEHGRGTLTIATERAGDIIRASVADDGPGITEENLGHLFDPFFTTKEVGKGTGLGLSISYGIITAHGGRIYAESEAGKGATFIVELPLEM